MNPPRKRLETITHLALFSLMVLIFFILWPVEGAGHWIMIASLAGAVVYFGLRRPGLLGPSLFMLFCYLFRLLILPGLSFLLVFPIVIYTGIVLTVGPIRRKTTWLAWGAVTPRLVVGSIVVVAVSSTALVAWYLLLHPDIAVFTQFIPARPLWQLLIGGLGFALLNATVEEVIFRGIVWDGVEEIVGNPWGVLVAQAVLFGTAHFHGVPSGITGACLAFIYGIMLGVIRMRARGLLMVTITHVFADIVIFCILLDIIGRI
jgi:membrane protease YdiL (CAAX protease family)